MRSGRLTSCRHGADIVDPDGGCVDSLLRTRPRGELPGWRYASRTEWSSCPRPSRLFADEAEAADPIAVELAEVDVARRGIHRDTVHRGDAAREALEHREHDDVRAARREKAEA